MLLAGMLSLCGVVQTGCQRAEVAVSRVDDANPASVGKTPNQADRRVPANGASQPSPASSPSNLASAVVVAPLRSTDPAWMTDRDDPTSDGWDTEVFNRVAGAQLKSLAKMLEHASEIQIATAEKVVAPEFSCHGLRPSETMVVFQDPSLVVRRASSESGANFPPQAATPKQSRGSQRLVQALEHLAQPLPGDVRVKFKVFRVDSDANGVTTHVYFEASGHSATSVVQQSALWICRWQTDLAAAAPRLLQIRVKNYEEVATVGARSELFADCTRAVLGQNPCFDQQLRHGQEYWMRRIEMAVGATSMGQGHIGLAIGDVNNDGLEDVYVCQLSGLPNLLFLQNRDGTATEIAASAGVDYLEQTRGALLVDLDNDGDQDLVLALHPELLVLAGDGSGQFSVVARLTASAVYSLAASDYDGDGDLDLFACRYSETTVYDRTSGLNAAPIPYYDANNGAPSAMFRNDGNWEFVDVTREVGLDVNNRRFSFAASWEDYDNDGDVDLYVANDYGRNNLYRNDVPAGGGFVDVAAQTGVEDIATGMSTAWGDYDRDGWMDLYVGNMWSSAGNRVSFQPKFQATAEKKTRGIMQRIARGNTLFKNNGNGSFRDVSDQEAVTMGRWSWGSTFVDVNNDGWEDLVVANGFVTGTDADDL